MDLRTALGTMHDALLNTGDQNAEKAGVIVRTAIEEHQKSLQQVLAQIRRDDSGHFFVSREAEDILRKAAKLVDVPWFHIDPKAK